MKKIRTAILTMAMAAAAGIAMAQPAPGSGAGPGNSLGAGPGNGPCAGSNAPCGPGYGPGGPGTGPGTGMGPGGRGMRGPRFGRSNTYGWGLMTPEERQAHRDKMYSLKTVDECNAYAAEHRKLMEDRAKEKGLKAPAGPRVDMCARMQQRGFFGTAPAK